MTTRRRQLIRSLRRLPTLGRQFAAIMLPSDDRSVTPRATREAFDATLRAMFRKDPTIWLSSQVEPLHVIRRRAIARDSPTPIERFHQLLHRLHTMRAGLVLGAITLFVPVGIALAYAAAVGPADETASTGSLPGALLTVAEVLGGLAGILLAVIVFGIQFHGDKLGHAAFAVRYLPRREGVMPIAAFTLGVIGANVFIGLVAARWLAPAAEMMVLLDFVFVPLVLLGAGWLLARMIVSASGDFYEQSVKPGLAWEYQRALDEEERHAKLMEAYQEALQEAGLSYSNTAGWDPWGHDTPVTFKLNARGEVADVNLRALGDLGRLIVDGCPGYEARVGIAPNDRADGGPALALTARWDDSFQKVSVAPLSQRVKAQIQAALQQVFAVRRTRTREALDSLSRLKKAIVDQAEYDQAGRLKPALDVQEHLIKQRLKRDAFQNVPSSLRRDSLPDFFDGRAYLELAGRVVASASRDKVEVLRLFADNVMRLAVEYQQFGLFWKALDIGEEVYRRGIKDEAADRWIGSAVDFWIHAVLRAFNGRRAWPFDRERAVKEMPALRIAIGWVLRLTKHALEADRRQDAEGFHARIFEFDRNHTLRERLSEGAADIPPELCEVCDLHTYAQIAIAGWCMFLAQRCGRRTETIKSIFDRTVPECGNRRDLAHAWERLRADDYGIGPIDEALGLEYGEWVRPDERLQAKSSGSRLRASDWVPAGFVALVLRRPGAEDEDYDVRQRETLPAPTTYDFKKFKAAADALLGDEYVRSELLGLDEASGREAREAFIALIRERELLRKRDELSRIVRAPLSPEQVENLRRGIEESLNENRWLLGLIRQLGGGERAASACVCRQPCMDIGFDKQDLLKEPPGLLSDLSQPLGVAIAEDEDMLLAWVAERVPAVRELVEELSETPRAVRDAIAFLKKGGFRPSLIFVPHLAHLQSALLGANRLGKGKVLGPRRVRPFEGVAVTEWPYVDPTSIAVVDVASFYGQPGLDAKATPLTLEIEDRFRDENLALLAKADAATDPEQIPGPHQVRVEAVLRLFVGAGVANPAAATKIALDPKSLGHAMRRSDDVYHRPDCGLLAEADDVEFALSDRLAEGAPRKPCPTCRPND